MFSMGTGALHVDFRTFLFQSSEGFKKCEVEISVGLKPSRVAYTLDPRPWEAEASVSLRRT